MSEKKLIGAVSLVTGAGVRLGAAIACRLADEGSDVVIHYGQSEAGARETLEYVKGVGRRGALVRADLSRHEEVLSLARESGMSFGRLDVLVNNASVYSQPASPVAGHDLLRETLEEWERSLNINTRAPFFLMQQLAPLLSTSGRGTIVNILDTSASHAFLSRAAHSISKAALKAATELAARSLKGSVRVNALELGSVLAPTGSPEAFVRSREWSGVEVACDAVVFLLNNSFITGEVVCCAGKELL